MSHRKKIKFPQQRSANQAPLQTQETQAQLDARLKAVMDEVGAALTKHKAVVAVSNLIITDDGKIQPQVSIRLLAK